MKLVDAIPVLVDWWNKRGQDIAIQTNLTGFVDLSHEEDKGYLYLVIKVPYGCCDKRIGCCCGFSERDIQKQENVRQLLNLAEAKYSVCEMSFLDEFHRHGREDHRMVG